ncbi:UNVERIFIED_CONTAM: hypothetical protein PYX00_010203 [Menopon gallinae]|uniref:Large ribosomal subunit protein uL18m n=1 Tax=Menopon gallinae TaxID=328185 RepID=A0AAW2HEL9_9NEOP
MNISKSIFLTAVRCMSNKPTSNNEIMPFIYNRNPRNLERLRLARKPKGYPFEKQLVEYWHRLSLTTTRAAVIAELIHNSGNVVIRVSTLDWSIRQFLYSCRDTQAYIILARVFAERCMESGFTCMASDVIYHEGTKVELFLKELLKEGISLREPTVFNIHDKWRVPREKRPWTVLE